MKEIAKYRCGSSKHWAGDGTVCVAHRIREFLAETTASFGKNRKGKIDLHVSQKVTCFANFESRSIHAMYKGYRENVSQI